MKKFSKYLIIVIIYSSTIFSMSCSGSGGSSSGGSGTSTTASSDKIAFTDMDMDEDEIEGTITITREDDESNITEYRLYWGSDSSTKLGGETVIEALSPTGSNLTYDFTQNTAVPTGATYFLVYTAIGGVESSPPESLDIPDSIYKQVDDIHSSGDGSPNEMALFGDKLYFSANDNINGFELWVYDDNSAVSGSNPQMVSNIFSANGATGHSYPSDLTVYNGTLYFRAENNSATGQELWTYSGTGSPSMLIEINGSGDSSPQNMQVFNNRLYFMASSGSGFELWEYNDQLATPQPVGDKHGTAAISFPSNLKIFNSNLFFQAFDASNGFELWSYNGSTAPALVNGYNINSGSGNSEPAYLTVLGNNLYFNSTNGTDGKELWKYSGSGNPTQIRDSNGGIYGGSTGSNPIYLTVFNDKLYFSADGGDGNGKELWVYDPAVPEDSSNPQIAADINTAGDSSPEDLIVYNGKLYFSATDGTDGVELWVYDETNGARMVTDLVSGASGSSPDQFTLYNSKLFMRSTDGVNGRELWVFFIK